MEHNKKSTLKKAINYAKIPVIISLFLTPVRYCLELIGLPEYAIFIIGLLWLTLGFAIYLGIKVYNKKKSTAILLLSLVVFSPFSRVPVAVLWWVDTKWEIGTHYGLYFNSFGEALLNHVVYGSLVQIIPAFILGVITIAIKRKRKGLKINTQDNG